MKWLLLPFLISSSCFAQISLHERVLKLQSEFAGKAVTNWSSVVVISNPPALPMRYALVWTNKPLPFAASNVYAPNIIESKTSPTQKVWAMVEYIENVSNVMQWPIPMNHRQDFFRVGAPRLMTQNADGKWVGQW